jgi:hypothetical protein
MKCFVDVSRRIQRGILGTMIRKLSKLKLGAINNWDFFNVENNWLRVEGQLLVLVILYLS